MSNPTDERELVAERYQAGYFLSDRPKTYNVKMAVQFGWDAALKSELIKEVREALLANLEKDTGNPDHDWTTCGQPSCVIGRAALAKLDAATKSAGGNDNE